MKLAYSTNAYMRFSIEEAVARVAGLGYAGVELMADTPHAWPAHTSADQIDAIRATVEAHGLTVSNVNAFMMNAVGDERQPYWHPSWIEPNPDYRRIRVQHTHDAIDLTAALGAACLTTEPGGPLEGDASREEAMDLFIEGLSATLNHAEDRGVLLLVEPEPGLLIETVDQCVELCERIDSPAFGVNFDIGHLYCVGEPLPEAVARLAPWTKHYHVEDIAASRVHEHLVPGRGAIDFGQVFEAIRRTGYDGWITVELYPYVEDPDGAGAEARTHLSRFLRP